MNSRDISKKGERGVSLMKVWKEFIRIIFAGAVLGLIILFLGCGEGEFTTTPEASVRAAAPAKTAPETETPSPEKTKVTKQVWSYDPTGKRDPFEVPLQKVGEEEYWVGTKYDLDQMWVDGIIWGAGQDVAHILLPGNQDIFVKVGDELGINHGRIKQISGNQIVVEEVYVDPANPSEIHIIEKILELSETKRKRR
jgi:type IV pilus assembly protein PilP